VIFSSVVDLGVGDTDISALPQDLQASATAFIVGASSAAAGLEFANAGMIAGS
jgi:hypothetical protein